MRAAPLAALALVAAGCGASTSSQQAEPQRGPRTVFVRTCGACHTLAAAGTHGTVGQNLDDVRPSAAEVRRVMAHGTASMPPVLLDPAQARLVARYVARVAGS